MKQIMITSILALTTIVACSSEPKSEAERMQEDLAERQEQLLDEMSPGGVLQVPGESKADGGGCNSDLGAEVHWWGVLYWVATCNGSTGEYCSWGQPWIGEETDIFCTPTSCACVLPT
jgi:hypothetical protein